jgi:hypothetical protein
MSCRNVETVITELARGQMMEARTKEDAIIHMEDCQRCAARFTNEQTLTNGLRAVTVSAASIETPARVEAALLAAFRQGATSAHVPVDTSARPLATPWLPWSIAAAAAILIFSVFALPRLLPVKSTEQAQRGVSGVQPNPSPAITTPESASVQSNPENQADAVGENSGPESAGGSSSPHTADRRRALMQNAGLRNRPIRGANSFRPALNADEEIRTEFLPLTYGGNLSQLDDGQVVRVELPRSALQSFGLPMNAERAGERVKADVLLGHDGVARAIRFVR